jgi:hypothetical protein
MAWCVSMGVVSISFDIYLLPLFDVTGYSDFENLMLVCTKHSSLIQYCV